MRLFSSSEGRSGGGPMRTPSTVVAPLARGGYNNLLFGVRPSDDAPISHVLRVYGNHGNARHIEHELAVLLQLQRAKLPFQIPAPEITRRGEMCATFATDEGPKLMVLLPFLKGANPATSDLLHARAVGTALAQLLKALKKVDVRGLRLPPVHSSAYTRSSRNRRSRSRISPVCSTKTSASIRGKFSNARSTPRSRAGAGSAASSPTATSFPAMCSWKETQSPQS